MRCEICGKEYKCYSIFSRHVKLCHCSIRKYYDKYLKKKNEGICEMWGKTEYCMKHTRFENMSKGYVRFCSLKCRSNSPKVFQKWKDTNKKRYNFEFPSKSSEVKYKVKRTCQKRYGNECSLNNPDIRRKKENTWEKKYGGHPVKIDQIKKKILTTKKKIFTDKLNCEKLPNLNLELLNEYIDSTSINHWKCLNCGFEFYRSWNIVHQGYRCPKCYPRNQGQSQGEIGLGNWIESLGFSITQRNRSIIGKEIDVYIPSLKIGIEYDGLWFHSKDAQNMYCPDSNEDPKMKQLVKTELCTKKDIQLIHIFDNEWKSYQDQTKELLRKILLENYDLIQNDCDMITLNRRFSKNPKYYQELGYEVNIIGPKLYPNKEEFKVWDVGYLVLTKKE